MRCIILELINRKVVQLYVLELIRSLIPSNAVLLRAYLGHRILNALQLRRWQVPALCLDGFQLGMASTRHKHDKGGEHERHNEPMFATEAFEALAAYPLKSLGKGTDRGSVSVQCLTLGSALGQSIIDLGSMVGKDTFNA